MAVKSERGRTSAKDRLRAKKSNKGKASKDKWKRGKDSSGGSGGNYAKIEQNANYVLLAQDDFEHGWVHWLNLPDGSSLRVNCMFGTEDEDRARAASECPLCRAAKNNKNISVRHQYAFNVLMGKVKALQNPKGGKPKRIVVFDPVVKLLEHGPMLGGQICSTAEEIGDDIDGEWEQQGIDNITGVILKVTREGQGMKTTYDARPMFGKFKVSGDLTEMNDLELYELSSLKEAKDALSQVGGSTSDDEEFEDAEEEVYEDDFSDEDEKPKKKKGKKGKKDKKKSEPEDEEDEDWNDDFDLELEDSTDNKEEDWD